MKKTYFPKISNIVVSSANESHSYKIPHISGKNGHFTSLLTKYDVRSTNKKVN